MTVERNRKKIIAEKLRKILKDQGKCDYRIIDRTTEPGFVPHWLILREYIKEGTMYEVGDLDVEFFKSHRKIRWPEDWKGVQIPYMDSIRVFDHSIEEGIYDRHAWWWFMCKAYYGISHIVGPIHKRFGSPYALMLTERRDRMKVATFIPAAIKDIELYLKSVRQALQKHKIDWSELVEFPLIGADIRFRTQGMNDEEVIEKTLRRAETLIEHRQRMREEWFPSDERRQCYESTMLYEDDPFREKEENKYRYLVKYPFGSGIRDLDDWVERCVKEQFEYAGLPVSVYNLEGHRVELVDYQVEEHRGIKTTKGGRLVINEAERLENFPLEKIGFLREEFPEMFG